MTFARKSLALALMLAFTTMMTLVPAASAQQTAAAHSSLAIPVTGSFAPSTHSGPLNGLGTGTLTGTLNIQRFQVINGVLNAIGTLVGTITNGTTTTSITSPFALPVTGQSGSCSVLSLTLGPLHLDLLGLVIDLNQVNLNITAQSGPGNLLGNLLCSVANLLNTSPLNLNGLATLLNQILGGLGL